ncbi:MAG: alpha/beta fold hydrolase [Neisseriaceae bacterium]
MQTSRLLSLIMVAGFAVNAYANKIIANEYNIPYKEYKIHLKEKKLSSTKTKKIIVLVNPLSIPSLEAFDVPNYSLMDALAKKGYDVWGIDFVGEGKSSYPKEMEINPAPIGSFPLLAKEALKELEQGIGYITNKTGQKKVSLLGWSWGSVVGAMYTIQNPKQVNHLVLYGSMYSAHLQKTIQPTFIKPFANKNNEFNESLPAYQNIPWKVIDSHWHLMIAGNKTIADKRAIKAVGQVYVAADPKPFIPNSLRRPMGPMKDLYSIWSGRPIYDIARLKTPTLVIYGDQDFFADHNLYKQLTNVKIKREIKLKEATHWLIYEKARYQFIDDVVIFLNKN